MTRFSLNLKPCPADGEDGHKWVFHAACRALEVGMTNEQVEEIEVLMTRDPSPVGEIEDPRYEIKEIGGRR